MGDKRDLSMYYQGSVEDIGEHPTPVGSPLNTSIWFDSEQSSPPSCKVLTGGNGLNEGRSGYLEMWDTT